MRGEFAFVFALIEEGAAEEEIHARINDRLEQDETFAQGLAEHMRVYRENARDASTIPESIADDDGCYARDRAWGREVLPRLDRLITLIAGLGNN